VKLPPGQKLADAHIAAPMRSAGVQLSGPNAHLVVRNLTATHPYNDGYNIHGDCRDVVFENIRALECGDDGISAHETAEYRVDGLVSIGNSTGITDTVAAHTSYNHVFIAGCHAFDLFFLNNGRYKVENAVVLSSSEHPLAVSAREGEHCELRLDNVLIRRLGPTVPAQVQKNAALHARRVTLENLELLALGEATFDNCLIGGRARPEGSKATGAERAALIREIVPPAFWKEFSAAPADTPAATFADVSYGPHSRQTMDVWLARSATPAPVVFYIHGGGWQTQDKTDIHQHLDVRAFLDAGISVASVNYRFLKDANAAKIAPPVEWPLNDAKRALQHLRAKARQWNLDKTRIAASGVSAGGASALWLALHADMADPQSGDPVARESTRLFCVAVKAPAVSLDPRQLRQWIPNAVFGAHAFGYANLSRAASFEPFLAARESYLEQIRRYSPYELAGKDAPPVFMEFPMQDKRPVPGEAQTDPSHSAVSGLMLQRKLQSLGVAVELQYPGAPRVEDADVRAFLVRMLTGFKRSPARPPGPG
jgi:acetyl esterase/lipase